MSHIRNIEIKDFKSIRYAKINDCRRVNILIGYPNVGKTNIIEAISFFNYLNKGQDLPLKSFIRFKEVIDIFNDGDRQKDAEIFTDTYVAALRYFDRTNIEAAITMRENYVPRFNESTSTLLRYFRFNKEGGIGRASSKDYEILNRVKKYQFKSEGGFIYANLDQRVLDYPYGSNLSEVIRYNKYLRKECGELFAAYNLKLIFDENNNMLVQKQLDDFSAFQFSLSQVADTLQRLIFHKAAIVTNENAILLFEEPEAHMFPPYISKFTSDIIFDGNNNQYFITTHSPFVVNDFMENLKENDLSVFIVGYKKETGETLIRRLDKEEIHSLYQYGIDLYMNLENYLPHEQ